MLKYCLWILAVAAQFTVVSISQSADFNGDGKQDIVWRNHAGNPVVWQMNGLAVDSRSTLSMAPDAASAIVGTGNFFGSGPGGILWVDSSNELSIWRVSSGAITQTCVVASGIDPTWSYLGIGDMDGDGIDDVWWRLADGSVKIFLIDGCNAPQRLTLDATADPSWTFAGIGDVDGAGRAALFWREPNGNVTLWRLHNSTSIYSTSLSAGSLATWAIAAVADFDGDGKADVLWRDSGGSQTALWLMNGTKFVASTITPSLTSTFAAPDTIFSGDFDRSSQRAPPLASNWTIVGATDVDGDGRADVILAEGSGDAAIWRMQGASVVATSLVRASGDTPYTMLTGWRMALDRPTITKVKNQVTVAWSAMSGPQKYVVYASSANDPAATGEAIAADGPTLSFGRNDSGYADKRYFAVGASYLGVQLPASPEAYVVEFALSYFSYAGSLAVADINHDGCMDILGALGDCHGNFLQLTDADMGLSALTASGRLNRDLRFSDFNGDGILDVVSNTYDCDVPECGGANPASQILLLIGNNDGTFTEDTAFTALSLPGGGYGETIVVADFNNDGFLDIFLPKYTFYDSSEHNYLMLNDGSGHFTDVADISGVAMRNVPLCARPEGAQATDVNNDGLIDIFAGSRLFLNTGPNQNGIPIFQDLGPTVDSYCNVITPSPSGLPLYFDEGAKFFDLDNSGQLSLAIDTFNSPPGIHILKFDGVAHFEELNVMPDIYMNGSFGMNASDLDGDGLSDLVVGGGFTQELATNPAYSSNPAYNALLEEILERGAQGDPDAVAAASGIGYGLPQLLINRAGKFVLHDFYDDGLTPTTRSGDDLQTFADFDASGTVDWVARCSQLCILMNRAVSHDNIIVSVVGEHDQRNQAGRVVRVSPLAHPNVIMTQVVDSGSGYMSNGPYDLTFATPYPGPYTVTVRFASGSYVTTVLSGKHVTMRSNGTYSVQ